MALAFSPGAPGVYALPPAARRPPVGERMDVCGFVGVAPRGPACEPVRDETWTADRPCLDPVRPRRRSVAVPVESMADYHRLFGGFDGPGRLPFAVAAFFAQGGQRAYVVRVVPGAWAHQEPCTYLAHGVLGGATSSKGPLFLMARNPGPWGNRLRAALGYAARPVMFLSERTKLRQEAERLPVDTLVRTFALDGAEAVVPGTLLRLRMPGGAYEIGFVHTVERCGVRGTAVWATLRVSVATMPEAVEVIEGILLIDDGDGRRERHTGLGLSPLHPRWMATVLCDESALVYPHPIWAGDVLVPQDTNRMPRSPVLPALEAGVSAQFSGGADGYEKLTPSDFFDEGWDALTGEPGEGVHALAWLSDLVTVVVPDLYVPEPLPEAPPGVPAPASPAVFARCETPLPPPVPVAPAPALPRLRLDPRTQIDEILGLQRKLIALAETCREFMVLLDVPPALSHRQILAWRAELHSSFAAAYHGWLRVSGVAGDRDRVTPVLLNPSAAAAGIIARSELSLGIAHGPANALVVGAIDVEGAVSPTRHAELHQAGINVYLRERDGVRLTGARTLAGTGSERSLRQLSVKRLMIMLRRLLARATQWAVFEPGTPGLAAELGSQIRNELRHLYRGGAFRGASEDQAFFVHYGDTVNTPQTRDAGQVVVEVGVAPAEPLEFLVLRVARLDDGSLSVEV